MKRPISYAFIDSRTSTGVRDMGWKLDWKRFRIYLSHKYRVEKAFLFIGFIPENQRLYSSLQQAGFVLIFKTVLTGERQDERQRGCRTCVVCHD